MTTVLSINKRKYQYKNQYYLKLIVTFLLISCCFKNYGQCPTTPLLNCELVRNGDFELYVQTPTPYSKITNSCGWMCNNQAAEYYNAIAGTVPCNSVGYQSDKITVNHAYAGILNNAAGYSEYIYTELNQTLLPNTTYTLSFEVSLAEYTSTTAYISAYLSPDLTFISTPSSGLPSGFVNMSINGVFLQNNTQLATTYSNWTTVTLNFTTNSSSTGVNALKYLVLGVLDNSSNSNTIIPIPAASPSSSCSYPAGVSNTANYSFIDNVSLKRDIKPTASPQTIYCGNKATLTATFPIGSGGGSFSWYSNPSGSGSPISNSSTFVTPILYTNTTYYVSYTLNGCTSKLLPVPVTVNPSITITTQPISQTTCSSIKALLSVVATSATGGPLTYQWYLNSSAISSGTSSSLFTITPGTYYVVITDPNGNGCSVTSNTAVITVHPAVQCSGITYNGASGGNVTLTANASGGGTLTYNWTLYNPVTGQTYTASAISNPSITFIAVPLGSYNVTLTISNGFCSATCYKSIKVCPSFTTSLVNKTVCLGSPVSFNCTVNSTAVSYQWIFNGNPITGANSNTYSISSAALANIGNYSVVVSSAGCESITSTANLSVINVKCQGVNQIITGNPTSLQAICSVTTNIGTLSYFWQVINPTTGAVVASANTSIPTYTFTGLTAGLQYIVIVTVTASANGVICTIQCKSTFKPQRMANNLNEINQKTEPKLYPNPTNDIVNIEVQNGDKIQEVKLFSINGVLLDLEVTQNNNTFNLQKYPNAEYIVIIKTNVNDYNFKIVKK